MSSVDPGFAFALWCDDIRQELGNKPSFMGVYVGGLVVHSLPVVLPRMSIWATLSLPVEVEVGEVSACVRLDNGTELFRTPPTKMDLDANTPSGAEPVRRQAQFYLTLSPLPIPEGTRYLEIVLSNGDESFVAPRLHVQPSQPSS